jgi:hypothetical protein
LKITKRPKLRPKDILHRRSLEGNAASSDVPAPDAAVVHDFPIHVEHVDPFFSPDSRYVPREVRPATSAWERPLMVQLFFRGQLTPVIVPAHARMISTDKEKILLFNSLNSII